MLIKNNPPYKKFVLNLFLYKIIFWGYMNIKYIMYSFFLLYHYCSFSSIRPLELAFRQCEAPKIFNSKIFSQLLSTGDVGVNDKNCLGIPLLYVAVKNNNFFCAQFLLNNNADVNLMDALGHATPLHVACMFSSAKMVRLLLTQKTINPNIKSSIADKDTPLTCLSKGPEITSKDLVKILLENKFVLNGINECDKNSYTALAGAALVGNLEIVKMLLEKGANIEAVTQKKWTALHIASYEGHFHIIKCLIDNKANVMAQDVNARTPLHIAVLQRKTEAMKLLIDGKANVNACDKYKCTPMHFAIDSCHLASVQQLFFCKNRDLSLRDYKDRTLLYCSVLRNNIPILQFLIPKLSKQEITYVNSFNNFTAFEAACALGLLDCVRVFLDARIASDSKVSLAEEYSSQDENAVKIAIDYGYQDIANYIREFRCGTIVSCQYDFTSLQVQAKQPVRQRTAKRVQSCSVANKNNSAVLIKEDTVQKIVSFLDSDEIKTNDDKGLHFITIHDYDRGVSGGYRNEIFLFAHDKQGSFYEMEDKQKKTTRLEPIKQLDNIGSELPKNPLAMLVLSKHVQEKMKNLKDNFHAFCSEVECNGDLGHVKVCDLKTTPARKEYLKKQFNISESLDEYWFELTIDIPGHIRFIGYPQALAKNEGPLGNFNYIVLKKNLADVVGLCVHRFFTKRK